ncbi:MAG: 50S ribosomal protein L6 [Candidatus Krumholzibacteria bacterium]|nr:50S ribosomal protein L6 [Candidatus Krumholzibacteria bacterium]
MSRVGKKPIELPDGVEVGLSGVVVRVKGPRGELERALHPDMAVEVRDGAVIVSRPSDSKPHRSLHGLTRTLVANMIEGVSKGYVRELEIEGVEYRAEMKGRTLVLALGFSHPVQYEPAAGVEIETPELKKIVIRGIDKHKVGQVASEIRRLRPPEPFRGKGIRYAGEQVRRKAGKSAVGTSF